MKTETVRHFDCAGLRRPAISPPTIEAINGVAIIRTVDTIKPRTGACRLFLRLLRDGNRLSRRYCGRRGDHRGGHGKRGAGPWQERALRERPCGLPKR